MFLLRPSPRPLLLILLASISHCLLILILWVSWSLSPAWFPITDTRFLHIANKTGPLFFSTEAASPLIGAPHATLIVLVSLISSNWWLLLLLSLQILPGGLPWRSVDGIF